MSSELDKWQRQLEAHFQSIAAQRTNSNLPTFALEHCLSCDDIAEIQNQIESNGFDHSSASKHWLVWTVYAVEFGYLYEGNVFWEKLENLTPNWHYDYRPRVRAWFKKFESKFNGFKPKGAWANQFSIICWPITHAILPKYLQRRFAHMLFSYRYPIARISELRPVDLGKAMKGFIYHPSNRIMQFLQEEALVGSLTLEILGVEQFGGPKLIEDQTLKRLLKDLEKVRDSKEWLKETRIEISRKFDGLSERQIDRDEQTESTDTIGRNPNVENRRLIFPSFRLRYIGNRQWQPIVKIPNFSGIADFDQEFRTFLNQTRCKVNGNTVWMPPGWTLSGNRQTSLKNWPKSNQLIKFEKRQPNVENIVNAECQIGRGPIWLFKLGKDGMALEISGQNVRPDQEYVIASLNQFDDLLDGMVPCEITCPDITSIRYKVPSMVSEDIESWFIEHKLGVSEKIKVFPVGIPALNWNGEGYCEWLSTDTPTLAIHPDHVVPYYEITLNNEVKTRVNAIGRGLPTYFRIPDLGPGLHKLEIKANYTSKQQIRSISKSEITGYLEMNIREPETWIPEVTNKTGLLISKEPTNANLDELLGGGATLQVTGPKQAEIDMDIRLESHEGSELLSKNFAQKIKLPLSSQKWNGALEKLLSENFDESYYFESSLCEISIDGREYGRYVQTFERIPSPIQWIFGYKEKDRKMYVRFFDNTGETPSNVQLISLGLNSPAKMTKIDIKDALNGLEVKIPGSLYFAKIDKDMDIVLVSHGFSGRGLESLGLKPNFDNIKCDSKSLMELLKALRIWKKARAIGKFSYFRKDQAIDSIKLKAIEILTEKKWKELESQFKQTRNLGEMGQYLKAKTKFIPGLEKYILENTFNKQLLSDKFTDSLNRYGVCSEKKVCEFAFNFACRPDTLIGLYKSEFKQLFDAAKKIPYLVESARYIVLFAKNKAKQSRKGNLEVEND